MTTPDLLSSSTPASVTGPNPPAPPAHGPTLPPDGWTPAWAVPAVAAPPSGARPPGPPSVVAAPGPGWAWIPDAGWVPLGQPGGGPSNPVPPMAAAASGAWPVSPPSAADPMTLYPGAALATLPLEPVVPTSRVSSRRGPSAYLVVFSVSALLCAAGLGFAAGRMSDPSSAAAAGSTLGGGPALMGSGPGVSSGVGSGVAGDGTTSAGALAGASGTTSVVASAQEGPTATLAPIDGGTPTDGSGGTPAGGPPSGGFPGGGTFTIAGTITAIGDGSLTVETEDGQAQTIVTDPTTTYHQQVAASAADVSVGATVRVATSGGFPGRGPSGGQSSSDGSSDAGATITATDVTVVAP